MFLTVPAHVGEPPPTPEEERRRLSRLRVLRFALTIVLAYAVSPCRYRQHFWSLLVVALAFRILRRVSFRQVSVLGYYAVLHRCPGVGVTICEQQCDALKAGAGYNFAATKPTLPCRLQCNLVALNPYHVTASFKQRLEKYKQQQEESKITSDSYNPPPLLSYRLKGFRISRALHRLISGRRGDRPRPAAITHQSLEDIYRQQGGRRGVQALGWGGGGSAAASQSQAATRRGSKGATFDGVDPWNGF